MSGFDEWLSSDDCDVDAYNNPYDSAKKAWDARQAEIDAITKQRDSFIKAHHISMNDVCELKAEIDELQSKYDAMYRAFTVTDEYRKEWHRCYMGVRKREDELQKRIDEALEAFEDGSFNYCQSILKGNQNEN